MARERGRDDERETKKLELIFLQKKLFQFVNGCRFKAESSFEERKLKIYDRGLYQALNLGQLNALLDELVRAAAPKKGRKREAAAAGGAGPSAATAAADFLDSDDMASRVVGAGRVLRRLLERTSARTMTWVVKIILSGTTFVLTCSF